MLSSGIATECALSTSVIRRDDPLEFEKGLNMDISYISDFYF